MYVELTSYLVRYPQDQCREFEDCLLDHRAALVIISHRHPKLPRDLFVVVQYGSEIDRYCLAAVLRLEYGCTAQ